jgi:hypothetical protein
MGALLTGLEQRVIVSGRAWFDVAGSYADYHYVTLDGTDGRVAS